MSRKRIGVIVSQSEQVYQKALIEGFLAEAFAIDMDVLLFTPFLKESVDAEFVIADNNIFNIINYDNLDGIVFVADTINEGTIRNKLIREFASDTFKLPVLYIDYKTDGAECVMHNDTEDCRRIVEHLIEVHGYTRIGYMTGYKNHLHAEERLKGYRQALEKHGIPFEEERVFYGDFWYEKGEECVEAFLNGKLPKPQAIACASDSMAISVIDALEARGINVPNDIAVTGYDCSRDGIRRPYTVTSLPRSSGVTGKAAARKIYSMIIGTDEVCKLKNTNELFLTDTCGCSWNNPNAYLKVRKDYYAEGSLFSIYNTMLETLIKQKSVTEFMWLIKWYSHYIVDAEKLYICLCSDWQTNVQDELNNGYGKEMILAYSKEGNNYDVDLARRFPTCDMIPDLYAERPYPTSYCFSPFHFQNHCFGYIVLSYGNKLLSYEYEYVWWVRFLDNAFESLCRQLLQRQAYDLNQMLTHQVIETQEEIIIAFAEITESKSEQTGHHIKRVSEYTRILAEGMGMLADEVETLRMASMLHDVGKLIVPSEILEKPGKLTTEEFDIVKKHVTFGEKLLHNAPGRIMQTARIIALEHHEKWNGKGYLGRKGSEINIYSQIVAVADVFDALISKRSYKDAWEPSRAYETIVSERGEHFSPDVVEVFVAKYRHILDITNHYIDRR